MTYFFAIQPYTSTIHVNNYTNNNQPIAGSPIQNAHIDEIENDYLYHFNIDTNLNLKQIFGKVNIVITAGDSGRITKLAQKLLDIYKNKDDYEVENDRANEHGILTNLTRGGGRFVLYCVDHILLFNHGMGSGSCSIAFHEIFKLLHYSKVDRDNIRFIRIGTCGGVGVEPGTICFTRNAMTETLDTMFPFVECGQIYRVPMILSKPLTDAIIDVAKEKGIPYEVGNTLGTNDFYLGQGRLDGAFCNYNENDKRNFLVKLSENGVKNIEMESHTFSAFCTRAKVQGAVMCVALVNRMIDDQIRSTAEERGQWVENSLEVLIEFCQRNRV